MIYDVLKKQHEHHNNLKELLNDVVMILKH